MQEQRFSPRTATAVVIANMVGTGVFTSLGFQLVDIRSSFVLMLLWLVGGVVALCGALCYAELGAALPRSGGEYNFLYQIYHPAAGYVSGWVSATIGFAAPTALAAITFASYLGSVFRGLPKTWLACLLVLALTAVHASTRRSSAGVQRALTTVKVLLITGFCVLAWLLVDDPQHVSLLPGSGDVDLITGSAFAVSLIYVSYAYTGWNAATYLTSELAEPQRNLSRVLITGTLVVTVLYLALNWTFLYVAPMDAMAGKVEVGYVAAVHAFGSRGGQALGIMLAALLISTVSAMVLAGPRVLQVIGEDFAAFRLLARTNRHGVPHVAIILQSALTLLFIATASFEPILVFTGFTLGLNAFFSVLGLFVLRWRRPHLARPYRTPLYPLPPLVFLGFTGWMLAYIAVQRPDEAVMGLAIVASGFAAYLITVWLGRRAARPSRHGAP